MKNSLLLISSLFCSALAIGCAKDGESNTTKTTNPTNNPSGEESGSETGASATDGSATVASATDGSNSDPTMASMTNPVTTTEDPGTGGTTAACSFLNCDDVMNTMNECDNWAQDCPEGQKCTAYIAGGGGAWDATKCVDVPLDPDVVGDPCTSEGAASGVDSCEKGAMCWGVDDMGMGTCVALCTGSGAEEDPGMCEPGQNGPITCVIANMGVLNLCLENCDPLLQDCLNPAEACYPINAGFTCAPDASGEEGQENDSCAFINVCDKGLACIDAAVVGLGCEPPATGCCSPMCDTSAPNPCNVDNQQECVPFFDPEAPPFPGAEIYGVCGIPTMP